ncbi:MAG: thioredoxin family protein [Mycobacteriales bacterium]
MPTIALLYVPDCPSWRDTKSRLQAVLAELGLTDQDVEYRVVTSREQAEREGLHGSPTLRVDGLDPFADPDGQVSLRGRVYLTEHGPAGAPSVPQLRAVLRAAGAGRHPFGCSQDSPDVPRQT